MPELQYVFFREDGRIFGILRLPTADDLDHARIGLVTILRISDLHYYGRSGRWEPLPGGVLETSDPAEAPSGPFHMPARG